MHNNSPRGQDNNNIFVYYFTFKTNTVKIALKYTPLSVRTNLSFYFLLKYLYNYLFENQIEYEIQQKKHPLKRV